MTYLVEDTAFTHVIAIDFGTGASGYLTNNIIIITNINIIN